MAYLWNPKLDKEKRLKKKKVGQKITPVVKNKKGVGEERYGAVHSKKTANKGPSGQMKRAAKKKIVKKRIVKKK